MFTATLGSCSNCSAKLTKRAGSVKPVPDDAQVVYVDGVVLAHEVGCPDRVPQDFLGGRITARELFARNSKVS